MQFSQTSTVLPLLDELRSLMSKKPCPLSQCGDLLSQLKLAALMFESTITGNSATAEEETLLFQEILERSCLIAIHSQDPQLFLRNFHQLEGVYSSPHLKSQSPNHNLLLACYLLSLLAENNLSEFHIKLDMLSHEIKQDPLVHFAIKLERSLMEGAYFFLNESMSNLPTPEFQPFIDLVISTTREDVAECIERSFETLPLSQVAQLLSLGEKEAVRFVKEHGWQVKVIRWSRLQRSRYQSRFSQL
ncbi:hypothetical protein GEMRC1_012630 [Eukaryota sp. GEM-RC1]